MLVGRKKGDKNEQLELTTYMGQFVAVLSQERPSEGMMPLRHYFPSVLTYLQTKETFIPCPWAAFICCSPHFAAPQSFKPLCSAWGFIGGLSYGEFPCSPFCLSGAAVKQIKHLRAEVG